MTINETELDRLVELIFRALQSNRWLYWPPGPSRTSIGQVFDKNNCKNELRRFLESSAHPLIEP